MNRYCICLAVYSNLIGLFHILFTKLRRIDLKHLHFLGRLNLSMGLGRRHPGDKLLPMETLELIQPRDLGEVDNHISHYSIYERSRLIPMSSLMLSTVVLLVGLIVLVWSADKFVEGAAATAFHAGMPSLLIGMVVIGFGTSAPEMVVSAISASQGNPGLALGNAYGSNISNIALILGITALISPIQVKSGILRKELPVLLGVTVLAVIQLVDLRLDRLDAVVLLIVFFVIMGWWIFLGLRERRDSLEVDLDVELEMHPMPLKPALFWLVSGMLLLVASSRALVWAAVDIAHAFGVSDLIIGLTIVAVGTSLPELASAVAATKKGEHDLALGNVIGSNLFNTLAVVGIAAAIHPLDVGTEVLYRDCAVMGALTVILLLTCIGIGGQRRITRVEGGVLVLIYLAYSGYLVSKVIGSSLQA